MQSKHRAVVVLSALRSPHMQTSDDLNIAIRMLGWKMERWATKRTTWTPMTSDSIDDFPKLTRPELRDLTLTIYQIKQAKLYTKESVTSDGSYELFSNKEDEKILRVKLQPWRINSKQYQLRIQYNNEQSLCWYCQCKVGNRTVAVVCTQDRPYGTWDATDMPMNLCQRRQRRCKCFEKILQWRQ